MNPKKILEAFDAKLKQCSENETECNQEGCYDIGKYWRAAYFEILRFRNELLSQMIDEGEIQN